MDILVPSGTELDRIILLGIGDKSKLNEFSWLKLGGKLSSILSGHSKSSVMLELPGKSVVTAKMANDMAQGLVLGAYRFDRYKTKSKKPTAKSLKATFHLAAATAAKRLWVNQQGVTNGITLARDLVNEPANILTPVEFAKRANGLKKLGCQVTILDGKAMKALKMNALLGVSQGSRNPASHGNNSMEGRQGQR